MTTPGVTARLRDATGDRARVVEYRGGGTLLNLLPWVLILVALAMAMLTFDSGGQSVVLPAVLLLVLLPGLLALDLWKMRPSAPPGLVLTARDLALRTDGWGELRVPWASVLAIERRSFEGFALRYRGRQRIAFDGVTMIRLPAGFLQAERAAGRFVPKGPTVDWVIRPDAEGDWIALHHETYSLTPAEVCAPVEARWRAFRAPGPPLTDPPVSELPARLAPEPPVPVPAASQPSRPAAPVSAVAPASAVAPGPVRDSAAAALPPVRLGGFRPRSPPLFAFGTAAGLAAIVIVLANIAGLWETRGQAEARAWAARLEAMRDQDRAWRREQEARDERFRQMFERPGFPFNR